MTLLTEQLEQQPEGIVRCPLGRVPLAQPSSRLRPLTTGTVSLMRSGTPLIISLLSFISRGGLRQTKVVIMSKHHSLPSTSYLLTFSTVLYCNVL